MLCADNGRAFGVAECDVGNCGRHHQQLADERVGDTVAVLIQRNQRLGHEIIAHSAKQIQGAVDGGARRAGHTTVVLHRKDYARPGRAGQCFTDQRRQFGVRAVLIFGQPSVSAYVAAGVPQQCFADAVHV